ncbi:MAG: hypothetical protein ACI4MI_03565 [Christensenellales bacterium]
MKMCEICGKHPATIFIKTNINGVKSEKQVCSQCAKMLQNSGSFADIFGAPALGSFFDEPVTHSMRVCPKCGMTEREVLEQSRFGCSECYETFRDIADGFVGNLGGKTYVGQVALDEKQCKQKSRLEMLKEQLDKAVEDKDFLKANDIQNEILALKKGEK